MFAVSCRSNPSHLVLVDFCVIILHDAEFIILCIGYVKAPSIHSRYHGHLLIQRNDIGQHRLIHNGRLYAPPSGANYSSGAEITTPIIIDCISRFREIGGHGF